MSPYSTYVRLFAEAAGEDFGRLNKRLGPLHIKNFEIRISNWMTNNGWSRQHIVGLIFFCHWHNPLFAESRRVYGNLDNVGKCVGLFRKWINAYQERIDCNGMLKTIIETAPQVDVEDLKFKALSFEEVKALYG